MNFKEVHILISRDHSDHGTFEWLCLCTELSLSLFPKTCLTFRD